MASLGECGGCIATLTRDDTTPEPLFGSVTLSPTIVFLPLVGENTKQLGPKWAKSLNGGGPEAGFSH